MISQWISLLLYLWFGGIVGIDAHWVGLYWRKLSDSVPVMCLSLAPSCAFLYLLASMMWVALLHYAFSAVIFCLVLGSGQWNQTVFAKHHWKVETKINCAPFEEVDIRYAAVASKGKTNGCQTRHDLLVLQLLYMNTDLHTDVNALQRMKAKLLPFLEIINTPSGNTEMKSNNST